MKLIEQSDTDKLFSIAKDSKRKRAHLNLHSDYSEKVQRLLIALLSGSYVEPHYHELCWQWEMFLVIQGVIQVKTYDFEGNVIKSVLVGDEQQSNLVHLEPGDIHSVECISDKALMLEVKEGPFDPGCAKLFPSFI
ncbi:WbuC family cupin fold metalloprotein [Shewanella schlegeliana]|uniref:WbuC family cupin fold metalloprotein n=1 Tax=Shewanella schlegeliana TaxID=190308 RepID=A0ABS1SUP4_9GAMM|nr:WbuC family cupin fold metalloprotein [Shewanella schlegeliana]MBL4911629.1 WbuC family cupin fold metalloprotein [Shewanella schlegeliana]MCL1111687.1 WbuC family cupin fold metalloprotein [Shewanella schlegeliana]GIU38805.1 hypothetical protein TUM4433_40760 [Shewanella schlegeliana]